MDSDEYKYLQPNFDPNTLKVAELRNILVRHDVEFNMAAKKSELIDLFKADIARRAPTLRRELNRPSAKPVTTPKDIERVMIRKERTPEPEPSDSKKPPSAPRTPRRSTKKVQASSATAKPSVVGKKRGIDSRSSTEHSDASGGETADKPKPVRKPRVAGTARRSDSEIDPGSKLEKRPPVRRAEAVPPKQETRDSKFVSKREAEGKREPTSSPPSSPKVEKPVTPSGTPSRKRKAQDREDEEGGDKKEGDKAEAEETSTRHLPPLTPSKKKKKNKTE
ncbi:inner nuclear membrane protein enriched at telomere/subtelomere region, partial [Spiromyces aspiralis]